MDGGRNNQAIAEALGVMAQALQVQHNQYGAGDEFRELGKFQRNNPPTFKGIYDLESP